VLLLPGGQGGTRAGREPNLVVGADEGAGHTPVLLVAERLGQVLVQRPAEGHVQYLHAAADPQQRHVPLDGAASQCDLDPVAIGHGSIGRRVRLSTVLGRIDVVAAGQDERVDSVEHLVGVVDQRRIGRDDDGQSTGPLDRVHVGEWEQGRRLVPHSVGGVETGRADSYCRSLVTHVLSG
jgi:hypothetical protein